MIIFFFCLIKCKLYLYLISYLVFRCPEFEGTGADSISVDGFHIDEHTWNAIIQECVSTLIIQECVSTFQTLVLRWVHLPDEHFTGWGTNFMHHSVTNQLQWIR